MDVSITIRDEPLHTIESPCSVFFAIGGLKHHTLQVRSGIRLREIHRHRLSGTNSWDETSVLFLCSEFVKRFDTILERPNVSEARIRYCH